jgi:hypothetical protein
MVSPEIDDLSGELGAIVHKHGRWRATLGKHAVRTAVSSTPLVSA